MSFFAAYPELPVTADLDERHEVLRKGASGKFVVLTEPLTGYKKVMCHTSRGLVNGIATLVIPKDAEVYCSQYSVKLRASCAIVQSIEAYSADTPDWFCELFRGRDMALFGTRASAGAINATWQREGLISLYYASQQEDGSDTFDRKAVVAANSAVSLYDKLFVYRTGQLIKPDVFSRYYETCAGGIHFFLDGKDAILYS